MTETRKLSEMAPDQWPTLTPEEWQEAADAAVFSLGLEAAIQYGLITGPPVDVPRCEQVLADAQEHGAIIHTLEELLS